MTPLAPAGKSHRKTDLGHVGQSTLYGKDTERAVAGGSELPVIWRLLSRRRAACRRVSVIQQEVGPQDCWGPWTLKCSDPPIFGGQTLPNPFWPGQVAQKHPRDCRPFLGFQKGAALAFISALIGILIASFALVFWSL